MKSYEEALEQISDVCFDDILRLSREFLPREHKRNPRSHPGLGHGVIQIQTEEVLCAYIAAYGKMHQEKIDRAVEALWRNDDKLSHLSDGFEIVDWGCGQGLATVCFLDYIRHKNIQHSLSAVTLIEPSSVALKRAETNVKKLVGSDVEVHSDCKILPPDGGATNQPILDTVEVVEDTVVHLFSNILDVPCIDLKELTKLTACKAKNHYFICVGPTNPGSDRIDAFANYYANPIGLNRFHGKVLTSDGTEATCIFQVFRLEREGHKPLLKEINYYPAKQFRAAYMLDEVKAHYDKETEKKGADTRARYEEWKLQQSAFDVLAPFDIGAKVYDDVHPVLAVLNNIVTRGLPTKCSPFLQDTLSVAFGTAIKQERYGSISYKAKEDVSFKDEQYSKVPFAIARIQKVVLEALITERLDRTKEKWNVVVKENDVPCAALAFEDLKQMYNHLTQLSTKYDDYAFPEINLIVISNEKYANSPLHLDAKVKTQVSGKDRKRTYDLVIDMAMDEKSDELSVTFSEFESKNDCYFNIRSTHGVVANRSIYTTNRILYKDLVTKDNQGVYHEIPEHVEHLEYFLQLLFRKVSFRPGQLPILHRAMQNKPVIGLLPTGGGKSLTYQIAAMLQPGVTLIVDPLVSLMKDQYDGLINAGIDYTAYINSTLGRMKKQQRELELERSQLLFVFLSPERLCIDGFRKRLNYMHQMQIYFAYGVIDEVHCVSEWGHDFRFSYLHLGKNLYRYVHPKEGPITLFGLTATASFDVLADVERELSGNDAFPLDSEATVRYENANRLELQYKIELVEVKDAASKWDVFDAKNNTVPVLMRQMHTNLVELQQEKNIQHIKKEFLARENIQDKDLIESIQTRELGVDIPEDWYKGKGKKDAGAIVFCPHRQGSLGVNSTAKSIGISQRLESGLQCKTVSTFIGGDKLDGQDRFIQGDTSIMVATKAFGMGIDKPNVRFTINVNHSSSLESFVQEAGRAGRDRKIALATIMYCPIILSEQNKTTRLMETVSPDYGVNQYFYDSNFRGAISEKIVMFHLLAGQEMDIPFDNADGEIAFKTLLGFQKTLMEAAVGDRVEAYISYADYAPQLDKINEALKKQGKLALTNKNDNEELRKNALMAAYQKAIYRMCCIGLVDDYTQDYSQSQFKIVAIKKKENGYYDGLRTFLKKYYTEERVDMELQKVPEYKGHNEIHKCLGYLTEFIYEKIAIKRKRAIEDIQRFCEEGLDNNYTWLENNERLKDFIYYYFNSKYAREGYNVNGESFCLTEDTEQGKKATFETVLKYIRVIDDDLVESGSPKDNIKHLQGAVRLIRRSLTEANPALSLLNVFCLCYLSTKENSSLEEELYRSYVEGCTEFYKRSESTESYYAIIEQFKNEMCKNSRRALNPVQLKKLEEWDMHIEVFLKSEWLKAFKKNYIRE